MTAISTMQLTTLDNLFIERDREYDLASEITMEIEWRLRLRLNNVSTYVDVIN